MDVNLAMEPGTALCFAFEPSLSRSALPENTGVNFSVVWFVIHDDNRFIEEISAHGPDRKSGTIFHLLPSAEQDDEYHG